MFILKTVSYIFLFFVKLRIFLYKTGIIKSFNPDGIKIISIGNISLGGTGKTPTTIAVGKNLMQKGYKIAVLLRGYKRKKQNETVIVHNGEKISADINRAGDEALLLADKLKCPVVVSKNRVEGANLIKERFNPDFIILDDGFQHLKLKRDKDIVLLTQKSLKKDIRILPAGRYREPLSHIKRAHTVIITKIFDYKSIKADAVKLKNITGKTIYLSDTKLISFLNVKTGEKIFPEDLYEKECVILCGLAQPEYFETMLRDKGVKIVKKFEFPDHHSYGKKDYKKINKFKKYPVITTEKDIVKINVEKIESNILLTANIEITFHNPFDSK
jgi:tetraacyldisaccharide 4'-kinase